MKFITIKHFLCKIINNKILNSVRKRKVIYKDKYIYNMKFSSLDLVSKYKTKYCQAFIFENPS